MYLARSESPVMRPRNPLIDSTPIMTKSAMLAQGNLKTTLRMRPRVGCRLPQQNQSVVAVDRDNLAVGDSSGPVFDTHNSRQAILPCHDRSVGEHASLIGHKRSYGSK